VTVSFIGCGLLQEHFRPDFSLSEDWGKMQGTFHLECIGQHPKFFSLVGIEGLQNIANRLAPIQRARCRFAKFFLEERLGSGSSIF
jgi:hypothetical protein